MVYGATGHLDLAEVSKVIAAGKAEKLALVFGIVFLVSGQNLRTVKGYQTADIVLVQRRHVHDFHKGYAKLHNCLLYTSPSSDQAAHRPLPHYG